MSALHRMLQSFRHDTRGGLSVEAVIIMPLLVFTILMTVTLSDLFRANTLSVKAAYTTADTLSRRADPVTGPYIDGLNTLFAYLARARHDTTLRVSSVAWIEALDRYVVIWSFGANGRQPLTTANLNQHLSHRMPTLPPGETVIVVEADMEHVPLIPSWFDVRNFSSVIVTRPRFTPQLRFNDGKEIIFLPDWPPTCDDGEPLCAPGT